MYEYVLYSERMYNYTALLQNYHHDTALEAGADIVAGEEIFPEVTHTFISYIKRRAER